MLVKVNLLSNDCASWLMLSRARNELVRVNLLSNDCASWHMLSRARNVLVKVDLLRSNRSRRQKKVGTDDEMDIMGSHLAKRVPETNLSVQ